MNQKIQDLQLAKEKMRSQSIQLMAQEIDNEGLKRKIKETVQRLEVAPKESQRPLFANLVKSIEIHPMKIRLEIIAPTKALESFGGDDPEFSDFKTTGTDGSVLPFRSNRVGSSTDGNGASGRN